MTNATHHIVMVEAKQRKFTTLVMSPLAGGGGRHESAAEQRRRTGWYEALPDFANAFART